MIVLGLNFGDEGKGLTTSFLCETLHDELKKPLVVRFNGGHQAGHTVVYNGVRHIFQSFGSGTLQKVPTFWSKNCTIYPKTLQVEHRRLQNPSELYVDPLCPVTTPFDVIYNEGVEKIQRHGSVGLGFGATIERHEKLKLYAQDLQYSQVVKQKLYNIVEHYGIREDKFDIDKMIEDFIRDIYYTCDVIKLAEFDELKYLYTPVFEGAQGILLDQDFGFFPNVTRSNTTSKNALEMYNAHEVYYVTRSYLTRHGNGYLPGEKTLELVNHTEETNKTNYFQGKLRFAELDTKLMNYALACDNNFSKGLSKFLVITCMDQYPIDVNKLLDELDTDFEGVYISKGNSLKHMEIFR